MQLGEQEVGPAYNSDGSVDVASFQNDLDILVHKIKIIENLIDEKNWLEKKEYIVRNEYVEERLDAIDNKVDDAVETVNRCDETSLTNKFAMIGVNNQLQGVRQLSTAMSEIISFKYR